MQDSPVQIGEVLAGKFRVDRVLGKGGMGMVVAAWHLQLDQQIALKFLLDDGAADPDTMARFMREAKASAKLKSEHAAKVLDVGKLDTGAPYIVMEYLEGSDLEGVLDTQGPLPLDEAIDYVLQACEAVAEAHAAGIIHRDLKPANLFRIVRPDGSYCVKVLDFGISKNIGAADPAVTKTQAMMGTPFYMAPEQMRSARRVDQRADIWAFGMILMKLTTGHTAFERETLAELCAAVLVESPTLPREHDASFSPDLENIILRCLEKDPDKRFPDLAAFCAALAAVGAGGSTSASRVARVLGQAGSDGGRPSVVHARPITPPKASAPDAPHPEAKTIAAFDASTSQPASAPPQPRGLAPAKIFAGVGAVAVLAVAAMAAQKPSTPAAGSATATPSATASSMPPVSVVTATPSATASAPATATAVATPTPTASASAAPATPQTTSKPGKTSPSPASNPTKKPAAFGDDFGGRK